MPLNSVGSQNLNHNREPTMTDSTPDLDWRGFADGSAIRAAVLNRIHRELQAEATGTPADLEFLGLFRHRSGYTGSLLPGRARRSGKK